MPLHSLTSGRSFSPPETINNDRSRTICISGHREKSIIPFNRDPEYYELTLQTVKALLERYLDIAYMHGYDTFISGMAQGTDLWATEHIIKRKLEGKDIKLIGAVPYLHHADSFTKTNIDLLNIAENNCDQLILIAQNPDIRYGSNSKFPNTSSTLYRDRNYFMVNNSSALVAFFNEGNFHSGTAQTVNYARNQKLSICRFSLKTAYALIEEYKDINRIRTAIQHII